MKTWIAGAAMAVGLMLAGQALAGDYYIASLDEEVLNAVDLGTLVTKDGVTTAWTVTITNEDSKVVDRPHALVLAQEDFDCKGGRSKRVYMIAQTIDGEVVIEGKARNVWSPVPPDTRQEDVLKAICDPASRDPKNKEATSASDLAKSYRALVARAKAKGS